MKNDNAFPDDTIIIIDDPLLSPSDASRARVIEWYQQTRLHDKDLPTEVFSLREGDFEHLRMPLDDCFPAPLPPVSIGYQEEITVAPAPLTDAERETVYEGAPEVIEIGDGVSLHGRPTDASGKPIAPTGDSLPEQTLLDGKPAVLRAERGDVPPAGYVRVNRQQRRAIAKRIERASKGKDRAPVEQFSSVRPGTSLGFRSFTRRRGR